MKFDSDLGSKTITSKTATQMYALNGYDGQIIYNTTYKQHFRYSTGTTNWLPFSQPNPLYGFVVYDDFMGNSAPGDHTWNSVTVTPVQASALSMGIFLIRTATASTRSLLTNATNTIFPGTMDIYTEWIAQVPTLATVAEDFSIAVGINDAGAFTSGSLGVDNICFIYNRGVNGAAWIIQTSSNSVNTSTNTSSTIVAATWYRLGVLVKAGTSADFFVNGTNIGQITTNIPINRGTQWQARLDKIAGTANSDLQVDSFLSWGFFNGTRF